MRILVTSAAGFLDSHMSDSLLTQGHEVLGVENLYIGNPQEFTMLELANRIIAGTSPSSKVVFCDFPADDPKQRKPDIAKARKSLGWKPRVQLDEGLEITLRYFTSQIQNSWFDDKGIRANLAY